MEEHEISKSKPYTNKDEAAYMDKHGTWKWPTVEEIPRRQKQTDTELMFVGQGGVAERELRIRTKPDEPNKIGGIHTANLIRGEIEHRKLLDERHNGRDMYWLEHMSTLRSMGIPSLILTWVQRRPCKYDDNWCDAFLDCGTKEMRNLVGQAMSLQSELDDIMRKIEKIDKTALSPGYSYQGQMTREEFDRRDTKERRTNDVLETAFELLFHLGKKYNTDFMWNEEEQSYDFFGDDENDEDWVEQAQNLKYQLTVDAETIGFDSTSIEKYLEEGSIFS